MGPSRKNSSRQRNEHVQKSGGRSMHGVFKGRQGQCNWSEMGKGASRKDDVREVARGRVCRIWYPALKILLFTLSEMGAMGGF